LWLDSRLSSKREAGKLTGCGMVVVNPPYGFAGEAASILDWLRRVLAP
jgi:23S rRNA A2030 N6-methylase RlmJ